ncbi:MAG: hypothetical protein ABIJ41_03860 [Candidatus Omnitrophota bacterium]
MKFKNRQPAQVTIEFTFCFVVLLLIIYGCLMVFRWVGLGLAERTEQHQESMTQDVDEYWKTKPDSPIKQVDPNFYHPSDFHFVFGE